MEPSSAGAFLLFWGKNLCLNTPRGDLNMNLSAPTGFDLQLLCRLAQSFYRHVCFNSHERLTILKGYSVNLWDNSDI